MLQTIKQILLKIVDDIDAGNSNIEEDDAVKIIKALKQYTRKDKPLSKYQAYTYLNLSRAQFDNLVRAGEIPRGKKEPGHNELNWYMKDLIPVKKKRDANKNRC